MNRRGALAKLPHFSQPRAFTDSLSGQLHPNFSRERKPSCSKDGDVFGDQRSENQDKVLRTHLLAVH
jgi:hypothetical protein